MSDWVLGTVLKPIIVAIISASCYMVGYNEVTTHYATQLLEKKTVEAVMPPLTYSRE